MPIEMKACIFVKCQLDIEFMIIEDDVKLAFMTRDEIELVMAFRATDQRGREDALDRTKCTAIAHPMAPPRPLRKLTLVQSGIYCASSLPASLSHDLIPPPIICSPIQVK